MRHQPRDHLIRLLASLNGREVFCVYCGVSTGSVLDIHFTPVKQRPESLGNSQFSRRHREYMGTFSVFVECTWRIQGHGTILVGSGDATADGEEVFRTVRTLETRLVTQVILPAIDQILDFALCFDNGLQLLVFCDTGRNSHENFTVFAEDSWISVVNGCAIDSTSSSLQ
ncbi:hypothetical protein [Tuwongella immobilis]|uniref:Uncharacterized protein n=1 Tax=Tuwongella immobilis TaxID=692036 RepID=A0A6C2YKZ1_9BACT|nr:hypothetical protein [Tuwongella immobilis]VIP02096.1 unnamed protein product [Tuwongella immobilis]VTS00374.1 unnamed protein product [Tuwongella immobilis]